MAVPTMPGLVFLEPPPDDPTGLLALSHDVGPAAILAGAVRGMFPWSGRYPVPWCSPDPRAVFEPGAVRVPRSLRKSLRNRGYRVTYDEAFAEVVTACARTPRPGQPGTWLTPNLGRAWWTLHEAGHYHSVEVWQEDELVGGLVGLALGGVFFGDTMFHRARDASKVAFVHLCRALEDADYAMIDGQMPTPHLRSLGAVSVARDAFLERLKDALAPQVFPPGSWRDSGPTPRQGKS